MSDLRDHPLMRSRALAVKPPEMLSVSDWCGKYVNLVQGLTPKLDVNIAPHMREPLDSTSDYRVKELHWLWSPGGGKTTGIEGVIQERMANHPSNVLVVGQKDDTARRWMETRMIPSARKNPMLKHLLPSEKGNDRHNIRKTTIIFNNGYYLEAGGSSESNLQEKSMPMVILEEAWKIAEHPGRIQQAKQRTHDKSDALILFIGQAGPTHLNPDDDDAKTDLYREWLKTDQRTFSFKCDCCGMVQPYKWDQMKWDKVEDEFGNVDWNATEPSVRMTCANPDCDREWRDTVTERRKLADSGTYVIQNPNAEKGFVGYHANALCYWRIPWLKLVKQFHEANEARMKGDLTLLQQFIQQRLAEFWRPDAYEERHELVHGDYHLADYDDGSLVDHEVARTITVDVQQNSLWYLINAWTSEGKCYHLGCGEVLTFQEVDEIKRRYQVQPRCVLVDCGYRQDFVWQQCSKFGWTAFKGHAGNVESFPVRVNGDLRKMPYSKPISVQAGNGARTKVFNLCVNPIKDVVADMRAGRVGEMLVPVDVDKRFNEHLNAEVKRRVVTGRDRREQEIWKRIGHRDNHLLDCQMASVAFAMIQGLIKADDY